MHYIIAILLLCNIVIFHGHLFVRAYYWSYRKLIKPKFKVGEIVIINKELFEVIQISARLEPYSYFCLPLNKISVSLSNYYHQKELRAISALTKALF